MMRRGFTLVEMLIVVVVLVTLMTITFRLSSVGNSQTARATTIARMQRLENCLSGYYAAFGSYPPVKLYNSRDIFLKRNAYGNVDSGGGQNTDLWKEDDDDDAVLAKDQILAACRAQPVATEFPFGPQYAGLVAATSKQCAKLANSGMKKYEGFWKDPKVKAKFDAGFNALTDDNIGQLALQYPDWGGDNGICLFKFGLMSYLLPRYLVMMSHKSSVNLYDDSTQWCENNRFDENLMPRDALTGDRFNSWRDVSEYARRGIGTEDYARVANVPTQSVCARWMPNLEGICTGNHGYKLFGINISCENNFSVRTSPDIPIYSPDDSTPSGQYLLDGITVRDGWGRDFFYYSLPPYQGYTLWSAGANGMTFPPWIDRGSLPDAKSKKLAGKWVADDITHLSN